MTRPRGLLLEATSGWRLLTASKGELGSHTLSNADELDAAGAMTQLLRDVSPGRWQLIVAPAAGSILTARLQASDLAGPRGQRGQWLAYAAEEHLPWAAEELTVETTAPSQTALALALVTDRWEPMFTRLRDAGHTLNSCVPAALLHLQSLRDAATVPPDALVVFADIEGIQFVKQEAGIVVDWRFWPDGAVHEAGLIAAEIAAAHAPAPVHTVQIEPTLKTAFDRLGLEVVDHQDAVKDGDDPIWQGAQRFWKPRSGMLNLAVGRLAGTTPTDALAGAARRVLGALLLSCCVTAGALWWKCEQFRESAGQWRAAQVALFEETFPDIPVPHALSARFDSEHRRIVGQRGGGGVIELPGSALAVLRAVLAAHHGPLRCRFEEVNITDDLVEIEAQFRNHEDAARMVVLLQQQGLRVDPPQLQKLDEKRFGTRLRGRLAATSGEDD